jgi:hypothetical protein
MQGEQFPLLRFWYRAFILLYHCGLLFSFDQIIAASFELARVFFANNRDHN